MKATTNFYKMKNRLIKLMLAAVPLFLFETVNSQVTSITIETFYTDNGSIPGYPEGHSTYRIYANTTNSTDRISSVTGDLSTPLSLTVGGSGVWNHTPGGTTGDALDCSAIELSPLSEYDSYITIGYTCDNDAAAFELYAIDDNAYQWMDEMFGTTPYGSISDVFANTAIGAIWFAIPTNPASQAGSSNKVLLAQITTDGAICGTFNLQVFPNYAGPGSPYNIQSGLQFGEFTDDDNDGYSGCDGDCNNNDANVYPGATEVCNGIDDNCDGSIDEGLLITFYQDLDGDGYGNPNSEVLACSVSAGIVTDNSDCDDNNAAINPAASEVCNNIDDNCDSNIDEGFAQNTFYLDNDGDGYGNPAISIINCEIPEGYVTDNTDCHDDNFEINPGATETCNLSDDNCDGNIDEGFTLNTYYGDSDGDGFGSPNESVQMCEPNEDFVDNSLDCNDGNSAINPNAAESCNGQDDNCNGTIDEGFVLITYYLDNDGDGYGDELLGDYCPDVVLEFVSTLNGDCDDNNNNINPGQAETCNNIDDDCDLSIDEELTTFDFYEDADGDGYGNALVTSSSCSQPDGYVTDNTDCDDTNASINPAELEQCNDTDDNCDGNIDESVINQDYFADMDGDGFGDEFLGSFCVAPANSSTDSGDCDDTDAAINPDTEETCNDIDDNCDGNIDENVPVTTYYADMDGDGFGNELLGDFCTAPDQSAVFSGDCDDNNAGINPGAVEICNDEDENCDGNIDEGLITLTYYSDADGDGYGSALLGDFCSAPDQSSTLSGDCDDNNANVYPGNIESCNGIDDNCDEAIDNNVIYLDYYTDADGDGFGAEPMGIFCSPPAFGSLISGDCNDSDSGVNPNAAEICNSMDDNCDGSIDENLPTVTYYFDLDGDGFGGATIGDFCSPPVNSTTIDGDCDDTSDAISPNGTEICNDIDDNCDGTIDEFQGFLFYADTDGDTYGDANTAIFECTAPTGYVTNATDCDDTNAAVNPGATEVVGNDIDEDCDGQIIDSVDELNANWQVSVYPNPVTANINLMLTGANGQVKLDIFDAMGKLVSSNFFVAGNAPTVVECGQLSQGTYSIVISNNFAHVNTTFVKL